MELTTEDQDEQSSWEGHPFTQRTKKFFEQKQNEALQELFNACHSSTDPNVAMAYGRYTTRVEHVAYYRQRSQQYSAFKAAKV